MKLLTSLLIGVIFFATISVKSDDSTGIPPPPWAQQGKPNLPQGIPNLPQGMSTPAWMNEASNFPQGMQQAMSNFPQGMSTAAWMKGASNFPQGMQQAMSYFPQGMSTPAWMKGASNFPQGMPNFQQGMQGMPNFHQPPGFGSNGFSGPPPSSPSTSKPVKAKNKG